MTNSIDGSADRGGSSLVALTSDEVFWIRIREEARDNHVAMVRAQQASQLPDSIRAFIIDGRSDLPTWVQLITDSQQAVPVIAIAPAGSWEERRCLAQVGRVTVLAPTQQDLVEQALIAVERFRARPRVAMLTTDSLLIEKLQSCLAASLTVYDSVTRLWASLEELAPDVFILDLSLGSDVDLLAHALRQDARTARAALFAVMKGKSDSGIVFDGVLSRDHRKGTLKRRILARFRRSHAIRRLIDSDSMTGLANRRRARVRLGFLLRLAARQKVPISIAVLDLDRFKTVNDTYGHGMGDRVIKRLARILRHSFRTEDIAARIGGEEFLVAMYGATSSVLAERMEKVQRTLGSHFFHPRAAEPFQVSFSAGVAQYGRDGHDFQSLYEAADQALYLAKESGRKKVLTVTATPPPQT